MVLHPLPDTTTFIVPRDIDVLCISEAKTVRSRPKSMQRQSEPVAGPEQNGTTSEVNGRDYGCLLGVGCNSKILFPNGQWHVVMACQDL